MAKMLQKAQVGDNITIKLERHIQCKPGIVDKLGHNNTGRLMYLVTCGCGEKLKLRSVQLERVTDENR